MFFSNGVYDKLKFVAMIVLPAFATFYLGFGQLWGFPETEKVATSIVLFDGLLGTILQISSSQMKKLKELTTIEGGFITNNGEDDIGMPVVGLTLNKAPSELLAAKEVTFKVAPPPPRLTGEVTPEEPPAPAA